MENIYLIEIGDGLSGIFNLLRLGMLAMHYVERNGGIPYLMFSNQIQYFEKKGFKGTNNPFEYYFEQKSIKIEDEIEIIGNKQALEEHFLLTGMSYSYLASDKYISELARIYAKYITLNPETREIIFDRMKGVIKSKKTLGIHYRGTDFSKCFDNHPVPITVEQYINKVNTLIDEYKFEQVFIATDDIKALTALKSGINSEVVYYNDFKRSDNDRSVIFNNDNRDNNHYLLGLEALTDAYTLVNCEGFLGCLSQLDIVTRIIKKSEAQEFEYIEIINNGILNNDKKCWEPNSESNLSKRKEKLFDVWLYLLEKNIKISEYIKRNGYSQVVIYGLGNVGRHLYTQLKNDGVYIKYIIDRKRINDIKDCECYRMEDDIPMAEVVIVTAMNDFLDIKKRLKDKGIENVLSIEDVLYSLL